MSVLQGMFLMKRYLIIAGVNGAGKTTLYSTEDSYSGINKVNFDDIVRPIGNWKNSADVKKAGEIALKRIEENLDNGNSFSQETTLCGILHENLKSKSAKKVKYKKTLFDFTKYDSEVNRDNNEVYLRDDMTSCEREK